MQKCFTPEQELEVIQKYQGGMFQKDIAEEYHCHHTTVRSVLLKHNITRRRLNTDRIKHISKEQELAIVEMWRNGDSQSKIGSRFRMHQVTVSRILAKNGFRKETRHARGEKHGWWKGGRIIIGGYIAVYIGYTHQFSSMALSSGHVAEHRLVMAKSLDRPLTKEESVHHINGNKLDNRIENLQLRVGSHGMGQSYCCAECGSTNIKPIELK